MTVLAHWSMSSIDQYYVMSIDLCHVQTKLLCYVEFLNVDLRQVQSQSGGSSSEIEKLKKNLEEEKLKKIQVLFVLQNEKG